ncbi:hypothetical protein KUCAC02_004991, partial [Chaenocephalus aceratus]
CPSIPQQGQIRLTEHKHLLPDSQAAPFNSEIKHCCLHATMNNEAITPDRQATAVFTAQHTSAPSHKSDTDTIRSFNNKSFRLAYELRHRFQRGAKYGTIRTCMNEVTELNHSVSRRLTQPPIVCLSRLFGALLYPSMSITLWSRVKARRNEHRDVEGCSGSRKWEFSRSLGRQVHKAQQPISDLQR